MNSTVFYGLVLGLLPCLIPPYALRLNRVFGVQRVGWMLFAAFSLLALQQLIRFWRPAGLGPDYAVALDVLSILVPVLLLIGMVHIETLFKERVRLEQEEKRLRLASELQVRDRTAELDQVNEELQHEMALRKQGTEELRKSKEQYRFLFDENPQPMWIFDRSSCRFLAFNSATLRHYGFTATELRELSAKDLCVADEVEAFVAECGRTGPEVQRGGLWHHRKRDGGIIEVEVSAVDLWYAEAPARLVLARDVTAQRLLQQQLLRAQKMELTAQLAGGVADNFSRLITVLEGEANLVAQKCQDPGVAEPLKRIAATASCAAGLNRQLLALVRRHPMRAQPLDLNRVIETQAGILGRLLGEQITVETACWTQLPSVVADPNLVQQMLHNLALNAREAMPNGGRFTLSTAVARVDEAHARAADDARPGTFVVLTVTDTGYGMAPEVMARLFEPFFTTRRDRKAAGLGLATVHGLIQQHSGWIEVSSQPGAGSRFAIFFPCTPSSSPPA